LNSGAIPNVIGRWLNVAVRRQAATFPRDGPGALTNSRRGRFFVQIDPEQALGPEIV